MALAPRQRLLYRIKNTIEILADILGKKPQNEIAVLLQQPVHSAIADQPFEVGEHALSVTVSLGVAALDEGLDLQRLLQKADAALYAAKQAGRNLVRTG